MSKVSFLIRDERAADAQDIRAVTKAAFERAAYSQGNESTIVDSLRRADALILSLVAVVDNQVIGHVAFSPVTIDGELVGWAALGPLSVTPALQRQGVGRALVSEGLRRLWDLGINGCVLLGSKNYYGQFGFKTVHDLYQLGSSPFTKPSMLRELDWTTSEDELSSTGGVQVASVGSTRLAAIGSFDH